MKNSSITLLALTTLFIVTTIGGFDIAQSAVMDSNNYSIQSDSVNFGGGFSESDNYAIQDTLGEIATGESSSDNYIIRAGYQQMNEVYLALVPADNVTMSPSLGGLSGGTSNGSTTITVTTDSPAGYAAYLKASQSPAMQGVNEGGTIANYTTATSTPDFTFAVANTDAEFGFSPEGDDVADEYLDDGADCNTGSTDTTDACWGPVTTSDELIAERVSGNHPSGTETAIKFRLTIGDSGFVLEDTYVATTTVTVLAL